MPEQRERANALAETFATENTRLMRLIAEAGEDQLAQRTEEEGWPALMVAHHLAVWYPVQGGWIRQIITGQDVEITRAQLDAANARMAQGDASLTRASVLAELRDEGARAEALLRGLSDAELSASARMALAGGRPMTVEAVITQIVLGHFAEHVPHLRAALAEARASV